MDPPLSWAECNEPFPAYARLLQPSGERRVGVWRRGVRPGIAVPAPFVWRCLSGATVAPFPHPLIEPMAKAKLSLAAAIVSAVKVNNGFRAVSAVPTLDGGEPIASIILMRGEEVKKLTEKLD